MHPFVKNSEQNGILKYVRILLSISIVLSTFNPLIIASAATADTVFIDSGRVNLGEVANVSIFIQNSNNVSGMNLTLVYDQSIIDLANISVNTSYTTGHSVVYSDIAGIVDIELIQLNNLTEAGSVPVLDLTFDAIVSGTSVLDQQNVELIEDGVPSSPDVTTDGSITVNSAPEFGIIEDRSVNESDLLSITLNATDVDGDSLTFGKNVSNGTIAGNIFNWTPTSSDIGVHYINFSVNDSELLDYTVVEITVDEVVIPELYTASNPVNFANTTGNFWVLHEWAADNSGNITDGYNVSYNGTWSNVTVPEFNHSIGLGPHDWSNITVYAYNASSSTLSQGIESNVQIPNNPINITDVNSSVSVTEGANIQVNANFTDADNTDAATFTCNRTDIFTDFNETDGTGSWVPDVTGTYYVKFTVSDNYDSADFAIMEIVVKEIIPDTYTPANPVNFVNTTGNFWVLHEWEAGSGNITDSYNVSYNNTWYNGSSAMRNNTELDPHAWSNITVYAYNATSLTLSSGVESKVQIPNNPISITDVQSSYFVNEGDTLTIDANHTDPDDDSATFASNDSYIFDIDATNGVASWTTKKNKDIGTHYVNLTVSDGYGSEDHQVVTITVTNVNNPPELQTIGSQSVFEGQELAFTLNATDPDNETLTYSMNGSLSGANLNPSTGEFSWTPGYNASGVHYVDFIVTDPANGNDLKNVTITVNNVNRAPELASIAAQSVDEGQELSLTLIGSDDDTDDTLTYSMSGLPSDATLNETTGEFSWIPDYDTITTGSNDIEAIFTVSDGEDTASQYVIITVTNTNRVPEFPVFGTVNAYEGTELVLNISANDPDGEDSLSYSTTATFGTINGTNFEWTPDHTQSGLHDVEFTVSDGSSSDITVVTVDVEDVNLAPEIDTDSIKSFYILDVGETVSFNVIASDFDDNPLTYSVIGLPESANNSLDPSTGAFSWTPVDGDADPEDGTAYYAVFTVSDGNLSDSVTTTFAVDVLNTPPILEDIDPQQINETETLVIKLNASSDDGDKITYNATGMPDGSTFDKVNGIFEWTPSYEQSGTHSVTFSVSDGVFSETEKAFITVINVNRAPSFGTMPDYTVNESEELSIKLNGTDLDDGSTLTYTDNVTYGSISDDIFTWTPGYTANQTSNGIYHINFNVSDGELSDDTVVTVYVNDVNAPPVLSSIGSKSVEEEDELSFNLTATDIDDGVLTYSAQNIPTNATIDSSTGEFSWTPIDGEAGTYSVIFYVNDSIDNDYETVTITVTKTSSSSSSTTSSSGGGGGGGGGALSSGEEFDNIDFKDYTLKSVARNIETVFSFYKENNSIVSLSFTSELNGGQVKAVIEVLKDTSSQVKSVAPGDVYKNMNIYIDSNLGDDVIGNRVINFKVEKVWIEENNIDVSLITLCRYNSGEWGTLPTESTGEDEEYYYFTSTTPGFSSYAISSVDPSTITQEVSAQEIVAAPMDIEPLKSTEEAVPLESGAELPQKESSSVPYLVIIGLIGVMAIGVIGYRKRDYYEKAKLKLGNPDGKRYRRMK